MKKKHDYDDEMEAYLLGEMTNKEQSSFEEIIKNTPELAQDISIMNEIDDVLNNNIKERIFEKKLKELGNQYFSKIENNFDVNKTEKPIFSSKWIIGIIMLFLAIMGLWWLNSVPKPDTPEQIFAAYYEPYSVGEITRGNDIEEAYVSYYNNKEYDKASSFLEELVDQFPNEEKYKIILGNSYLNINPPKTSEAISLFEKVITKETIYQSTGKWYLALAFLKNNEKAKAILLLENLAEKEKGKYPQLAKLLLKET